MSQIKNRLQALTMLDRAFGAFSDAELEALVASLPDDHREAVDEVCGSSEGFTDAAARTQAMRAAAARGRVNGTLEQLATVLTDLCLAKCIELLGDASDNPSQDELLAVTPALIEEFGLATTRLMLASSVAGEAAASAMLTGVLRHDETLQLPAVERTSIAALPAREADDDTKAKRKAAKEKKQAEAAARRAQQAKARHR